VLRVTPDTNILVSGLVYRHGKPYRLLLLALEGEIGMTVSQPIIDEMADVLHRKFGMSGEFIAEAIGITREAARVVTPAVQLDVIGEDPPDNRILECAVTGGADYIVTGDKDLLRLKQYDAIRVITVSDFLDLLDGQGRFMDER
jgi:putative PIN family toxin of toxin-antitoxin system